MRINKILESKIDECEYEGFLFTPQFREALNVLKNIDTEIDMCCDNITSHYKNNADILVCRCSIRGFLNTSSKIIILYNTITHDVGFYNALNKKYIEINNKISVEDIINYIKDQINTLNEDIERIKNIYIIRRRNKI